MKRRRRRRKRQHRGQPSHFPQRFPQFRGDYSEPTVLLVALGAAILAGLSGEETSQSAPLAPASARATVAVESDYGAIPLQSLARNEPTYTAKAPPNFQRGDRPQDAVDRAVRHAYVRELPLESLSIYLIDLETGTFGDYQGQTYRYPASVAKVFWMVLLYAAVEEGKLPDGELDFDLETCGGDLCMMVQLSSNDAASRITDKITNTPSGGALGGDVLAKWRDRREFLNRYFHSAGYDRLVITYKNYPLYSLGGPMPYGRELQIDGLPPFGDRNQMTAEQGARIIYEIVTGQAVSEAASIEMMQLLSRDLQPDPSPELVYYHPIDAFFGGGLLPELKRGTVELYSKVGLTSKTRNEVAFIQTTDGQTRYVLSIFGDDIAYGQDPTIFQEFSRQIFDTMNGTGTAPPDAPGP